MRLKWVIAIGFCAVLAGIVIPRLFVSRELPQKLHGVWQTDAARYEERHFLLDKEAIGFDTGNGYVDWYHITRVEESSKGNKTIYAIEYESDAGAVFKRALIYHSDGGGTIRFKNQADIEWFLVDG